MKKLFFILLVIINLVSCGKKIYYLDGVRDHNYVMGNEKPDFKKNVYVIDDNGQKINKKFDVDSSKVNWTKGGEYEVSYSIGEKIVAKSKVTVIVKKPFFDNVKDLSYNIGDKIDFLKDVNAYDAFSINITNKIEVDTSKVNFYKQGIYDVIYKVKDDYGHETINVIKLTLDKYENSFYKPILSNAKDINYIIGEDAPNYLENIKCSDVFDREVNVYYDETNVKLYKAGTYDFYYYYYDIFDNKYIENYKIFVLENNSIKIVGLNDFEFKIGENKPNWLENVNVYENGIAIDNSNLIIDESGINFNEIGNYKLIIRYKTNIFISNVIINKDYLDVDGPTISGTNPLYIENKLNYDQNIDLLEGILVKDNIDGIISNSEIEVDSSSIDFNTNGKYIVSYRVKDSSFNETIAYRDIYVVDRMPPIINNPGVLYAKKGVSIDYFKDVEAIDKVDGNLTDKLIFDDTNIDINTIGTYDGFYEIEDYSFNKIRVRVIVIIYE